MKKSVKITIIICAAVIAVAALIFGGIAIHDKTAVKNAEDRLSVTNTTIELQQSDVTVTIDDVLNKNSVECTALFSNNAGSVEINAAEVNEYAEQVTVSLLKPILFNKELMLNVTISVIDTTVPEFTESIDEIEITEGDEINILDYFKAEDLSGDVNLSATEIDNTKIGEQMVTVTATDKNNNSSKKEVKIIVAAKEDNNSSSDNSGSGSKTNDGSSTRNTSNSGSKSSGSSNKASGGSSDKSSGGNSSSSGSSSGNSGSSSGSSGNTNSEESAQKNVSAKEVQAQVNAYIKSKGITLDSSMTPSNASWNGRISRTQERLNNGKTLDTCKGYVDTVVSYGDILSAYCYYDDNAFYILYW